MLLLAARGPERWSRRRHGATSKNVPAQPLTRAFTPSTWHSFRGGAAGEHGPLSPLTNPSGAWAIRRPQLPGWISSRTWPEVTASLCQRALREVTGRRAVGCSAHLIYVRETVRVFVCGNGFHLSHLSQRHIHSRPGPGVTRIIKNMHKPHPLSVVANTRSDILPFATL